MFAGAAPRWMRQCRDLHPMLLHAHFSIDASFALPIRNQLKIPMIVSLHGYDVTASDEALRKSGGGRLFLQRREELFARTEVFHCVSHFIREQALLRGFPEHKLWVNPIGIDLSAFQVSNDDEREQMVLFVGRLVEKKGCRHLIRAMHIVRRALPGAQLVIIGDGPLRQELQNQAATLLPGGHMFLGSQPSSVVRSWLKRAMVFSVPSVTATNGDMEGLGMVFCEAQAMGVPVVSFMSGGIVEAVDDGTTGFLLPELDEIGLAQKICKLLSDPTCWMEMSAQGQKRIRERFNIGTQTAFLESKYDEVLAATSNRK